LKVILDTYSNKVEEHYKYSLINLTKQLDQDELYCNLPNENGKLFIEFLRTA